MERGSRSVRLEISNRVFKELLDRITAGEWTVGAHLPSEAELSALLNVERAAVRAALQKLNAFGIVETRSGSGSRVVEFPLENHLKLASRFSCTNESEQGVAEFRNHMELECARLACERARPDELAELERLAMEHRKLWLMADELPREEWLSRVAESDMLFHGQVIRMSHNRMYIQAMCATREPIYRYIRNRIAAWTPEQIASLRLDRSRDVHYGIYEAIKRRDFDACQTEYAAMLASYADDSSQRIMG